MEKDTVQESIEIIQSASDQEISALAPCQREAAALLRAGCSPGQISAGMGKTRTYGYEIIKMAAKAIRSARSSAPQGADKKAGPRSGYRRVDYGRYAGCDLGVLTERERQALEARLSRPAMTAREISGELGITKTAYSVYLHSAARKLDNDGYAESRKDYRKKHYASHKEYYREKGREYSRNNSEKMREYRKKYWADHKEGTAGERKERNRRYYLEHREEILAKHREERKGMSGMRRQLLAALDGEMITEDYWYHILCAPQEKN